jgi:hypothetical protein
MLKNKKVTEWKVTRGKVFLGVWYKVPGVNISML